MRNVTVVFDKTMKMSDMIDADYSLLLLLHRLDISLGFGEKTVETVCKDNNFDADCFVFLANIQSNGSLVDIDEVFNRLPLEPFLFYLKSSHRYFLEERLPNIRRKLEVLLSSEESRLKHIILEFFDNYTKEVHDHMYHENDVVFPYIETLLHKGEKTSYSMDIFRDEHNDIEEKMNDLKQILMKYISGTGTDQLLIINILMELYTSEEELAAHTFIENNLVIPRVAAIEKK